ncbi:hypothetical protein MACH24_09350 [Erythrobacter sp. Dej080120_24]|uniref:class I SAM-dependent methyltransferase n=1 Tax=Erythrobacter sp. Dej080120_24 TaxID=3024837 RepID=UPI002924E6C6|nr:hypothetical protein MACH24_09350 [Erythrobacter sp. Dej080120_24]
MDNNAPAPPYTEVNQHGVFPRPLHDEAARYNFLSNFNRFMAQTLGPGNALSYENRVLPKFVKEHGREPANRHEVRRAMNADPFHRAWSALRRNSMEIRQQNGRAIVLRQHAELAARIAAHNDGAPSLALDSAIATPRYQDAVDIHCMPGSYHGEECPGDFSAGANYDSGIFATTAGGIGALSDGAGQAIVAWIKRTRPEWKPRRVLEIGTTIGHNIVPLALAYPDTEIIAIDTAAPVLRYGHARAKELGAHNIRFIQANGEDLSRWDDGSFDWVQTTMFLHETSRTALPRILAEGYRVLAPDGLMLHLEQPPFKPTMPVYEQFIRDWDSFNNNEPFWSTVHSLDLPGMMREAGFAPEELFEDHVKAVVDRSIFTATADEGEKEDHGRAAAWHALGGWKQRAAATPGA